MNYNASPFAVDMPCLSKPGYQILLQISSEINAQEKLKGKAQFLLSFLHLLNRESWTQQ